MLVIYIVLIHYLIAILFGPVIVKLYYKKIWYNLINRFKLIKYDRTAPIVEFIFVIMFWEFFIFAALFMRIVKLYFKYHPSFKEK